MKRMFATSALALTLIAGSAAIAGPDHTNPDQQDQTKAKEHRSLTDFVEVAKTPDLFIGSEAPKLHIAKFVKGDSVDEFEKGQVYVVEFWATWCGPCVAAFPHLSELQTHFGDKVKFIGVNVWEGVDDMAERIDKVEAFVADQGDRMSYTVAVEDGTAMADNWMRPAAQNGIPAAFIVDGTGHIAWIGHPGGIEEPLKEVVSGDFDSAKAAQEAKDQMLVMAAFQKFAEAYQTGKNIEDARQIGEILVDQYLSDEPAGLNAISWMILTTEADGVTETDNKLAHRAIALACEKTDWKDWSLLDTYALAAFKNGHKNEAIKWQKKAIELAPADDARAIKELKERLAEYEG
ncbi:MAG: redoxin domain-containing protein [Phycisphaerales bacterium]